jgi:hypothetical protein
LTQAVFFHLFLILALLAPARSPNGQTPEENSTNLPAGENELPTGSWGAIEGRAIFDGKASSREKVIVVKDRDVCGKTDHYDERLLVGKTSGIQNSVVSLTKVRGGKPLSTMGTDFVLDQKGCRYSPRILLLPINQDVRILNNDGILHNIHTFCTKNRPVNIAQTKFQKELKMKFKVPERTQAKCDVHGWMTAWLVIVDHPYHSLTNQEGKFRLTDIPPGTYTVSCWHELLGEQTTQVTVEAGSTATVDFRYSTKKEASGSN